MRPQIRVENEKRIVSLAGLLLLVGTSFQRVPVSPGIFESIEARGAQVENGLARFRSQRVPKFESEIESPRFVSSQEVELARRGFDRRNRRR
jgi:hypothetical protein